MYHSVSKTDEETRNPYYRTCTDPRIFAEHVAFLAQNGFKTIGLRTAVDKLAHWTPSTSRYVVLTFDDGFADFYSEAFPVLSRFGLTATMFLPSAYVGDEPKTFNGRECLTWSQVRELHGHGIEFGSHTATHPQLRILRTPDVRRELRSSKEAIEDKLGAQIESFSYPYAFPQTDRAFKQMLREILSENGYEIGVSTMIGTALPLSERQFLERIPVNSSDDNALFAAKLQGGYDWLHTFQVAAKLGTALTKGSWAGSRLQPPTEADDSCH